jgi:streptogramin lyase
MRTFWVGILSSCAILFAVPHLDEAHFAAAASAKSVARVRFIDHGLLVRPPQRSQQAGKVNMPLYDGYLLRTQARQRASIRFRDGTTLQINQLTDAILQNPHLTLVNRGEVEEILRPGTTHSIQAASAIAAALGTKFDIKVQGRRGTIVVISGAVEVRDRQGVVEVSKNHQTIVEQGKAPTHPTKVDAGKVIAWVKGIPAPNLGENLALPANGGQVVAATSERPGHEGSRINDGRLDSSWETGVGKVSNQSITIGFEGAKKYLVSGVVIDPAAVGAASSTDLKDFEIQISTNGTDDRDFLAIFSGTLKPANELQSFSFRPTPTRYLRLVAKSNNGSTEGISVAELEIVGQRDTGHLFNQPYGVAVDPQGNIDVAELTLGAIQRVSPNGRLLATIGSSGRTPGHIDVTGGIAVDKDGNIYVVDGIGRILKFGANGKYLLEWGSSGSGPGQFAAPNGVAVDGQGNVYVADSNNTRIEKFSSTGQFLAQFGGRGTQPGQFPYGPFAVALDRQGNIYVTPPGSVYELSPTGQQLARWGSPGNGPGQFHGGLGIALDAQGNIYVAGGQNNRIDKLSPSGQLITSWPTPGDTAGTFVRTGYLAVDAQGYVYASSGAHGGVVQKYSPTGQLVATWK